MTHSSQKRFGAGHGRRLLLSLMAMGFFAATMAFSQTANNGQILGTVKDTSGALIPGANVTLTNEQLGTHRSVVSDAQGDYNLLAIPAGTYDIEFTKSGFKSFKSEHIVLNAGDSLQINATLQVSSVRQTVTVPAVVNRVNTTSPSLTSTVTASQIANIPITTRSFTQLVALEPGVNSNESQEPGFGSNTFVSYSFSGSPQAYGSNYLVDGGRDIETYDGNNLAMISLDAIAQISILRNDYSAQYGRNFGGLINVITKSGTNHVHGSLFEYFRNDVLNARNFFATTKPPTRYNDFGGTLGGPIIRNKLFLFGSYEGRRIEQSGGTLTGIVPTTAELAGNFAGSAPITNPKTGLPFPGNQIPTDQINTTAQKFLTDYYARPTPGFHQGALNFAASNPDGTVFDEGLGRIDYDLNSHLSFAGHYIFDATTLKSPFGLFASNIMPNTFGSIEKENIYSLNGNMTWTPTTNFLNVLTAAFFRNSIGIQNSTLSFRDRFPGLTLNRIFDSDTLSSKSVPGINISQGYAGIDLFWPQNSHSGTFELRNDSSWIRGRSVLKFGGAIDDENKTEDENTANNNGTYTFTGGVTGNAMADFLLGKAFEYTEGSTDISAPLNWIDWSLYVQDQFKLTPRLTITPGIRWEYFPPEHDPTNHLSYFNPALFDQSSAAKVMPNGEIVPGTENFDNGIVVAGPKNPFGNRAFSRSLDTFSPRVGFAYALTGNNSTVLRGGYGIFYNRWSQYVTGTRLNYPFNQTASIFNTTFGDPSTGTAAVFPISMTSFHSPWKVPAIQKWSLDVQRQLPAEVLVDVAYVGDHGVHLIYSKNINQPSPNVDIANGTISANALVPFPGLSSINTYETGGDTSYNALQVSVTRQFASGLSFQVAYTYSKTMDDAITPMNALAPQFNEWALSYYDRTHVLVINYVYALPFFKSAPLLERSTLGGWQVSGITSFESGNPMTIGLPGDTAGIGATNQRPNVVGPIQRLQKFGEYFNTASFAVPATGTFGNASRDIVRGPGINNFDFSLDKSWDLPERASLKFSAQFFNIFNHPQFNSVDTGLGDPAFGQINGANDPRLMQLGLHLRF